MQENKNLEVQDVSLGSLYDLNKQILTQTGKELSVYALNQKVRNLITPFFRKTQRALQPKYFMLLCHERRDYTVFRLDWFDSVCAETAALELKECLHNRGLIFSIENTEDNVALEIWLQIDNEFVCYYLFPYDEGVIEV